MHSPRLWKVLPLILPSSGAICREPTLGLAPERNGAQRQAVGPACACLPRVRACAFPRPCVAGRWVSLTDGPSLARMHGVA